jgi:hypothetical protein
MPVVTQEKLEARDETAADGREQIDGLLTALSIERVISVDDSWAHVDGPAAAAAAAAAGGDTLLQAVRVLERVYSGLALDVDVTDPDSVSSHLYKVWDDLDPSSKEELSTLGREFNVAVDQDDAGALNELMNQFPSRILLERWGLERWSQNAASVGESDKGVLVLFDKDMSNDEGGARDTGERLLRDLLSYGNQNVRAGLLSFLLSTEQEEADLTRQLEAKFEVEAGSVVAIGKYRLTDGQTHAFPSVIRIMLSAKQIENYRKFAKSLVAHAAKDADHALDQLQRYSIAGAFAAAAHEGVFELDAPVRVATRAFHRAIQHRSRSTPGWDKTLAEIRDIDLANYLSLAAHGEQFATLLRDDQFDVEGLNEAFMPLEVGDIFEVRTIYPLKKGESAPARHYILLAQACDISIRGSGKRSPEVHTVVLHRMSAMRRDCVEHPRLKPIGRFDVDSDSEWFIDLSARIFVPVAAVDAVVYNADGRAVIDTETAAPAALPSSWVKRHELLVQKARGWIADYAAAQLSLDKVQGREGLERKIGASIVGASIARDVGVSYAIDVPNKSVSFGISRIARVHGARAAGLVTLATAYDGRPAFEATIARTSLP